MKTFLKLSLWLFIFFATSNLFAQTVSWQSGVEHLDGDLYQITITANIPNGWHIYDLGTYSESAPTPTTIIFSPTKGIEYEGDLVQLTAPICQYDSIMQMDLCYFEESASFSQNVRLIAKSAEIAVNIEWVVCNDTFCSLPKEHEFTIQIGESDSFLAASSSFDSTTPSLWKVIIESILWGFAALLTPCVFPIIPLTISFFLKKSENRTGERSMAAMYGVFIILLYTLPIGIIILLTRAVGSSIVTAGTFNWISTHWLPNILFFVVFTLFALSFFGLFDIILPSKLSNKIHSQSSKTGLYGVFFMALTLVVVSFSCTAPIVGTVLMKSVSGEFLTPIVAIFAFSVAFATPFTLFAFFPSWLNALPKSGSWLNSVKVVIGFIELALGLKFLSVADQTYHWGILDRNIYIVIWVVIFSILGFYLMGGLHFNRNKDKEGRKVSTIRLGSVVITFAFVLYLLSGLFGMSLKMLSGYLPPIDSKTATLFSKSSEKFYSANSNDIKYGDILSMPYKISGFFDLYQAEEYAAGVNRPLFIDFTGHGCVNCREMEVKVLSDPRILEILQENYVVVALYTDDRTIVDERDWIVTEQGKILKRLGQINATLASTLYGVNAQPYYILQGQNGKILTAPRGYNLNIDDFIDFLMQGIEAYRTDSL